MEIHLANEMGYSGAARARNRQADPSKEGSDAELLPDILRHHLGAGLGVQ